MSQKNFVTHVQELALLTWPRKGGMAAICELYGIDWTLQMSDELLPDMYLRLWECLLETETKRFLAVLERYQKSGKMSIP